MPSGAVDEAAFDTMSVDAKLFHIYHRVVSIESLAMSSAQAAQKAADCAEAVKATIDTEIDKHATTCLTARKTETETVGKTRSQYMAVIVLLVGITCTAIGYAIG